MNMVSLYGVLLYVVILILLSAFFIRKALHSYEEYSYCGRSLTIGFIFFSYLATWVGGGTIIGLVGKTYQEGAGQYWIIAISFVVQFFFVIFFLRRIRILRQPSIAGFLAMRFPDYGQWIRIPATIGILIRNITMTGMQFGALGYMVTYVFGINSNLSVLLIFLIITLYTVLSGLWGVVVTDIFQGLLQTAGILLLVVLTVQLSGGLQDIVQFYEETGRESFLNILQFDHDTVGVFQYLLAFGLFFLMSDQTDWARIYSSKSDKTAFWGTAIPLVVTLLLLVLPAYLGVFQRALSLGQTESAYVIYEFIFRSIDVKAAMFILVGLIAATMSTADSFMLASGTLFSNDIIKRFVKPEASDRELIFWSRAFVVISGAMGFAFAINISDVLYIWLTGIGMVSIIVLPSYFMAWFSRRANTKGCLSGMGFGVLYCIIIMFGYLEPGVEQILVGMMGNLLITYLISFLSLPPPRECIEETYYWSAKFQTKSPAQ